MKSRRLRLILIVAGIALAILVLVVVWGLHAAAPLPSTIAWRVQPDNFPVGTVLQNSHVEMSLGILSGIKPAPMPTFTARLPRFMKPAAEWSVRRFRDVAAQIQMHIRVDPPDFVEFERSQVASHISQGPFAVISFRLKTRSPGDLHGNLVVHLSGPKFGQTNIIVPLSGKVVASASTNTRAALIVETPYTCYSTENGHEFNPLGLLNSRLANRGVRVDFYRKLPRSLLTYDTILLAGDEMALLDPVGERRLKEFVACGGRLILAANSFYGYTVPKANGLLGSYGLQIIDTEARGTVSNSVVTLDRFTSAVTNVDFFRPSPITVTDGRQGKLLVETEDRLNGYVAVSRQAGRGEVIVLTQSLWWMWIGADPGKVDNLRLFENLLTP